LAVIDLAYWLRGVNNAAVGEGTIDFNAHHDLITNTGQNKFCR
jgi:hypothetical protein